jgi:hypothetical protein
VLYIVPLTCKAIGNRSSKALLPFLLKPSMVYRPMPFDSSDGKKLG